MHTRVSFEVEGAEGSKVTHYSCSPTSCASNNRSGSYKLLHRVFNLEVNEPYVMLGNIKVSISSCSTYPFFCHHAQDMRAFFYFSHTKQGIYSGVSLHNDGLHNVPHSHIIMNCGYKVKNA